MKQKIAVHIISGFLGAGKTTFLKRLLATKDSTEKWVVVLNEAGNTTYDTEALSKQGIIVKELYGGCLCCSAAVTFRVELNKVIQQHQPQRLFVEPAGAGHLANIKKQLQGEFYAPILEMRSNLCLVAQWQLQDNRYYENELYLALIEQADKLCFYDDETQPLAKKMAVEYSKPLYRLQYQLQDLE